MTPQETKEVEAIQRGYAGDVYETKGEAMCVAHRVAKVGGYCFVVEGRYGWHCSMHKPMLRKQHQQVIECRQDGQELLA